MDIETLAKEFKELKQYLMEDKLKEITKDDVDEALGIGNEAKSSVSYSLLTKSGFPFIFTVRENSEASLLDLMEDLEGTFIKRGFQADKKGGFASKPKEIVQGEKCPKCGSDLVKFTSKDGTKSGIKCSTSKWDAVNKKPLGCDYIKWNEENGSGGIVGPSEAQKTILLDKGLWREGLSKQEATEIITKELAK